MTEFVIFCDLDGTLFDCEHRQHHVQGPGKKNWKAFFEAMGDDSINQNLNLVLHALKGTYDIVFVSARPDNYRGLTMRCLLEKGGWYKDEYQIFMRKEGDFRQDNLVKAELLAEIRAKKMEPLVVFDDRKQVVEMWRANDVLCAQVADHDF